MNRREFLLQLLAIPFYKPSRWFRVNNDEELRTAVQNSRTGDMIVINPGTYYIDNAIVFTAGVSVKFIDCTIIPR